MGWLFTTFGAKFLDYDNDGWKDIFLVNGQVFPQIDRYKTGITYAERNLLFHNRGGAASGAFAGTASAGLKAGATNDIKFDEVGKISGPGLAIQKVSRGLAAADYDNDGDLEMVVTNMNDSPDLLRHNHKNKNHSILVKTIGVQSNRDGIGTEIEVISGRVAQYDWVRSGASYLSSSDLRVHFGLGAAATIDRMELHWPSGPTDIVSKPPVDSVLVVQEGKGLIQSKPFRKAM